MRQGACILVPEREGMGQAAQAEAFSRVRTALVSRAKAEARILDEPQTLPRYPDAMPLRHEIDQGLSPLSERTDRFHDAVAQRFLKGGCGNMHNHIAGAQSAFDKIGRAHV